MNNRIMRSPIWRIGRPKAPPLSLASPNGLFPPETYKAARRARRGNRSHGAGLARFCCFRGDGPSRAVVGVKGTVDPHHFLIVVGGQMTKLVPAGRQPARSPSIDSRASRRRNFPPDFELFFASQVASLRDP